MPSTLPPLLQDSAHLHHPALVAEAVDQISQTVQQLLLAALERARRLPAPSVQSAPSALPVPLSAREQEVLQRIAAGDSNKLIARALDLSPHTVKRHVANILDKLNLPSRVQAAAWWTARQLVQRTQDH
ncbi:response regulator transcription factor [Roseateles paludis]|jgi:LuxR family maltose regulon positive regulatory protein|uniref:LuxR C-terminal-related transcriptional regulator n=1 Tax=Roseateles paludis TaxID=3145238 RepID=A0ABV0FYS1_9BURK